MDSKAAARSLAFVTVMLLAAGAGQAPAATITVTTAGDVFADDGQCSLREAILSANLNAPSFTTPGECAAGSASTPLALVTDTIDFAIPGNGPFVMEPLTPMPVITESVFIDGYSQRGAQANTLRSGNDAVLMLELRGDSMRADCDHTTVAFTAPPQVAYTPVQGGAFQFIGIGASGSRLRGFAINGFGADHPAAVVIYLASSVTIDGNFIGLGTDGRQRANDRLGVVVMNGDWELLYRHETSMVPDGSSGNTIGGRTPPERNVISFNDVGVYLAGPGNRVEGNYIGVNPMGDVSVPNRSHGVFAGDLASFYCDRPGLGFIFYGHDNVIGGWENGGNFFSSEGDRCAVTLSQPGNAVVGNLMGTDRDGGPGPGGFGLGAAPGCGVFVEDDHSRIVRNTIAYGGKGVVVTAPPAAPPSGNDISANSIHSNASLGIDLGHDGATGNDADDSDAGANGRQNFPEMTSATTLGASGVIQGKPHTSHRLDFYEGPTCRPGEGQEFRGSATVTTDATGRSTFWGGYSGMTAGSFATATATTDDGTSELSPCVRVQRGLAATVSLASSLNPAGSHTPYVLTVSVRGSGPSAPVGTVTLRDPSRGFNVLGRGNLYATGPDSSETQIPSSVLGAPRWGNVSIQATYDGDPTYAPATSGQFTVRGHVPGPLVQTVYREAWDVDSDRVSDVLSCDGGGRKYLLQQRNGAFAAPTAVPALDPRTILGAGETGGLPMIVWSDGAGGVGATLFSGQGAGLPHPDTGGVDVRRHGLDGGRSLGRLRGARRYRPTRRLPEPRLEPARRLPAGAAEQDRSTQPPRSPARRRLRRRRQPRLAAGERPLQSP
jgi:CSLREA domain-containing protein